MSTLTKLKGLLSVLLIWTNIFAFLMYLSNKKTIDADAARYLKYSPFKKQGILNLNYCLIYIKQFRSVFYYRTVQQKSYFWLFSWLLYRRLPGIEIGGIIGEGLLLEHLQGTCLYPHTVGKNLIAHQGVTIGKGLPNEEGKTNPDIGDNVSIFTNAVVFGPITIGNNVKIGAGCVLNKSVPDNCTVVGNPARIVRRDGEKCDELL